MNLLKKSLTVVSGGAKLEENRRFEIPVMAV